MEQARDLLYLLFVSIVWTLGFDYAYDRSGLLISIDQINGAMHKVIPVLYICTCYKRIITPNLLDIQLTLHVQCDATRSILALYDQIRIHNSARKPQMCKNPREQNANAIQEALPVHSLTRFYRNGHTWPVANNSLGTPQRRVHDALLLYTNTSSTKLEYKRSACSIYFLPTLYHTVLENNLPATENKTHFVRSSKPIATSSGWSTSQPLRISPGGVDRANDTKEHWLQYSVITCYKTSCRGASLWSQSNARTTTRSAAQLARSHSAQCSRDLFLVWQLSTANQHFQQTVNTQLRPVHSKHSFFTASPSAMLVKTDRKQTGAQHWYKYHHDCYVWLTGKFNSV